MSVTGRKTRSWRDRGDGPAVGEFLADLLQVVVAHVLDGEHEHMLVLGDRLADCRKELVLLLAALLRHLCHVHNAIAPGLGHIGGC